MTASSISQIAFPRNRDKIRKTLPLDRPVYFYLPPPYYAIDYTIEKYGEENG